MPVETKELQGMLSAISLILNNVITAVDYEGRSKEEGVSALCDELQDSFDELEKRLEERAVVSFEKLQKKLQKEVEALFKRIEKEQPKPPPPKQKPKKKVKPNGSPWVGNGKKHERARMLLELMQTWEAVPDLAELCECSPHKIRTVLTRLIMEGKIIRRKDPDAGPSIRRWQYRVRVKNKKGDVHYGYP